MATTAITDHVARGLSRIITQFRDSIDVRSFVSILSTEVQVLESAASQVILYTRDYLQAQTDTKVTLTRIAKLVQARGPAAYLVDAQIKVNKSQGPVSDMLEIYEAIVEPSHGPPVIVDDGGDQGLVNSFVGGPNIFLVVAEPSSGVNLDVNVARNAIALMASAAPAGVRVILVVNVDPVDNGGVPMFVLDGSNLDSTAGFTTALDSPNNI